MKTFFLAKAIIRASVLCCTLLVLASEQTNAQSGDLVFIPDAGLRLTDASIPEIGYDAATGTYYLFHSGEGTVKGDAVATSKDGLTFSAPVLQTSKAFDPRRVRLPDGRWRSYFWDNPGRPQGLKSRISADGVNFTEESGLRYALQANDKSSAGIYELFANPDGTMVLLYLGDLMGLNNTRRAVSLDSGKTFTFDRGNILGDDSFGGGANSYVDITTIVLPDGRRRLFSMRQGHTIYTHTSSDGGKTWTLDPGYRLRDSISFSQYSPKSQNDPSVIRLPDGRYRLYVASYLNDGRGCCHWAIVSATTAAATSVAELATDELSKVQNNHNRFAVFPNPASERTIATFTLAQAGRVSLKLFDALGREVESVFEGTLATGTHTFSLSPEGRYPNTLFVRLQTNEGTTTKLMDMLH